MAHRIFLDLRFDTKCKVHDTTWSHYILFWQATRKVLKKTKLPATHWVQSEPPARWPALHPTDKYSLGRTIISKVGWHEDVFYQSSISIIKRNCIFSKISLDISITKTTRPSKDNADWSSGRLLWKLKKYHPLMSANLMLLQMNETMNSFQNDDLLTTWSGGLSSPWAAREDKAWATREIRFQVESIDRYSLKI